MQAIRTLGVLAGREVRMFFTSWKGIVISLISPLCMLVFLGPTLGSIVENIDYTGTSVSYISFFLPGIMVLALFYGTMFTAGNVVVADRVTGFHDMIKISPNTNAIIVLGYTLGAVVVGAIQCLAFLVIGLLFSPVFVIQGISLLAFAFIVLGALFFGAFGVLLGSRVTFSNFSLFFTLASIPLVYASTIFVPVSSFPGGFQIIVMFNPVSVLVDLFRVGLLGVSSWAPWFDGVAPAILLDGAVISAFFITSATLAIYTQGRFHGGISRLSMKLRTKKDKIMDSPVFAMIAEIIGTENLESWLPLIEAGRIDELVSKLPPDKVMKIMALVKDALGKPSVH